MSTDSSLSTHRKVVRYSASSSTTTFLLWLALSPAVVATEQSESTAVFESKLANSGIHYINVSGSPDKRYIVSSLGSGAALFDYDQDGDLDLYLVNGASIDATKNIEYNDSNRLYRNEGAFRFTDVTEAAGVADTGWGFGCTVGDIDNDGFIDLYVTNLGPNRLFRNLGDGTFSETSVAAGVEDPSWGASAAFLDVDGDSYLDLYVTNYVAPDLEALPAPGEDPTCQWLGLDVMCGPKGLKPAPDRLFLNEGTGLFREAATEVGMGSVETSFGLGVVVADYDLDGDSDLYVANDTMPNFLFQNNGQGEFDEVGFLSGVAYNGQGEPEAGMGVDFADFDRDGWPDLFVTNFSHETNTAYQNSSQHLFTEVTDAANLALPSLGLLGWSTRFADFDLDGRLDLFVVNGHVYPEVAKTDPEALYHEPNQLYWNRGDRFELALFDVESVMSESRSSRGAAFGDIDNDGSIDVAIVNLDSEPSLLRNRSVGAAHWLRVHPIGTASNRDASGIRVVLQADDEQWTREPHVSGSFLSASDGRALFGLGQIDSVDAVTLHWPNGSQDVIKTPPVDATLIVKEGVGLLKAVISEQ